MSIQEISSKIKELRELKRMQEELANEIGTLEDFLPLCDDARVHRLDTNGFMLTKDAPAGIIVPRFAE